MMDQLKAVAAEAPLKVTMRAKISSATFIKGLSTKAKANFVT